MYRFFLFYYTPSKTNKYSILNHPIIILNNRGKRRIICFKVHKSNEQNSRSNWIVLTSSVKPEENSMAAMR